jgi:hypothetical protein
MYCFMKKLFPFALLLCVLFSLSGISPVSSHPLNAASHNTTHRLWWYPTSGTLVGVPSGDAQWSIGPSVLGNAITFTRSGVSWGPYAFSSQGGGAYVAGGPGELGVIQSWIINDQVSFVTLW